MQRRRRCGRACIISCSVFWTGRLFIDFVPAAVEVCGSLADCGSRREEIAVPTTPTTVPPWTQCCSSRSRLFLGSYHLRGRAAVPSRCVQYLHCQSSRCSLKSLRRSTSRQTLSCRRPLVLVRRQLCHLHCLTACPAAVRARLLSSSLDVWPHVERQRGWQRCEASPSVPALATACEGSQENRAIRECSRSRRACLSGACKMILCSRAWTASSSMRCVHVCVCERNRA